MQTKSTETKTSIVFCHGLWADGSCFNKLSVPLQAEEARPRGRDRLPDPPAAGRSSGRRRVALGQDGAPQVPRPRTSAARAQGLTAGHDPEARRDPSWTSRPARGRILTRAVRPTLLRRSSRVRAAAPRRWFSPRPRRVPPRPRTVAFEEFQEAARLSSGNTKTMAFRGALNFTRQP